MRVFPKGLQAQTGLPAVKASCIPAKNPSSCSGASDKFLAERANPVLSQH